MRIAHGKTVLGLIDCFAYATSTAALKRIWGSWFDNIVSPPIFGYTFYFHSNGLMYIIVQETS